MSEKLWAGLFCLAVGVLLGGEAIAQEAETAKSQTALETEASRPALDLVDQAEQAQSAKDNAPSGKGKTEEPATSTTLLTTSTVTASGSTGTAGGAIRSQLVRTCLGGLFLTLRELALLGMRRQKRPKMCG
jgi:hypothetical protein